MDRVRKGELPWTHIDTLHRMNLDTVLARFGLDLPEDERRDFNLAWHRLTPWPDSVPGLNRLRGRFVVATLSNGNVSLLVDMAKNAGLPWDCVMSGELFQHYKPDPEVYLGAARLLNLQPAEVMMVAAHPSDLKAAARCGLKTAYVPRPLEYGPDAPFSVDKGPFDYTAESFLELAGQLNC
jgi:2-haloacid dehalogenase